MKLVVHARRAGMRPEIVSDERNRNQIEKQDPGPEPHLETDHHTQAPQQFDDDRGGDGGGGHRNLQCREIAYSPVKICKFHSSEREKWNGYQNPAYERCQAIHWILPSRSEMLGLQSE